MQVNLAIILYIFLLILEFIFLTYNQNIAVIIAPIFPLLLINLLFRGFYSIFDFRIVYLVSLFIWSFGKSVSLFLSEYEILNQNIVLQYLFLISFCPILVLFFRYNGLNLNKNNKNISFLFILLLIITFSYIYIIKTSTSNIAFLIQEITKGITLILGGFFILTYKDNILKKILILFIISASILLSTLNTFNRTSLLFPIVYFFLIYLLNNYSINKNENFFKLKYYLIFLLLLILFILSDLIKQFDGSITVILNYLTSNGFNLSKLFLNNNYIPEIDSAYHYFNTLTNINSYSCGILFKQLALSFMPRIYFIEKDETDISKILFSNNISPQPLYFEIFLEPYYDCGIIGVIIYHLFFLLLSSLSYNFIKNSLTSDSYNFASSIYILNLIILFYIIRGPTILLIHYYALPLLFFLLYIFYLKIIFKRY